MSRDITTDELLYTAHAPKDWSSASSWGVGSSRTGNHISTGKLLTRLSRWRLIQALVM